MSEVTQRVGGQLGFQKHLLSSPPLSHHDLPPKGTLLPEETVKVVTLGSRLGSVLRASVVPASPPEARTAPAFGLALRGGLVPLG